MEGILIGMKYESNAVPARTKGFTLIELLVVIAIIALLSSVVLASLTSARAKGKDATIKAQMAQMRSQSALYYSNTGNFYGSVSGGYRDDDASNCIGAATAGTVLNSTNGLGELMASAYAQSGGRIFCAVGDSTHDSWAVAVRLNDPSGSNTGWCVDSSGAAKEVAFSFSAAGNPIGGTTALAKCP